MKYSLSLVAIFGVLVFSSPLIAGERDELFEENQILKKSLKALVMDCTVLTVQCKERADASASSALFNESFEAGLQRNVDKWPNNEIDVVKKALEKRKVADLSFRQQFFGRASKEYKEASSMVTDLLSEADKRLEEYIRLGEKYLYENEKPDWAAPYFNKAESYAPGDGRILKGKARIRFLRDFESDMKEADILITTGQFTRALNILKELLPGDPENSEIIEIIKFAEESQRSNNINSYLKEFEEEYIKMKDSDTEGFDKLELIDRINNALLIFGDNEETKEIKQLRDKILADLYTESFGNLQHSFINQTIAIEDLYSVAGKMADLYPDKQDLQNLYKKITQKRREKLFNQHIQQAEVSIQNEDWTKSIEELNQASEYLHPDQPELQELYKKTAETRNEKHFGQLFQQAEVSIQNEDWTKSIEELNQASELKSSEEVKASLSVITEIYANNNKIIDITENSLKKLGTQREIDDAKNLIKNTKKLSKDLDTPMLDESIGKLEVKIQSYENMQVLKASQKKKSSPSSKIPTPPSSARKLDTPTASPPTDNSNLIKAKLDLSSFTKAAVCKKAIKNERIVVSFSIEISSTGKALSIVVNNEDEFSGSREREVLRLVVAALKKSQFTPAVRNGLGVVSVLDQKLTIPARFCRR